MVSVKYDVKQSKKAKQELCDYGSSPEEPSKAGFASA